MVARPNRNRSKGLAALRVRPGSWFLGLGRLRVWGRRSFKVSAGADLGIIDGISRRVLSDGGLCPTTRAA